MHEGRPLVPERDDLEPAGVDDRLVLVGVQRADGVDDRPTRLNALRSGLQEPELELRERLRAPAQVGSRPEDAEARARRVHERPVEAGELGWELGRGSVHYGEV